MCYGPSIDCVKTYTFDWTTGLPPQSHLTHCLEQDCQPLHKTSWISPIPLEHNNHVQRPPLHPRPPQPQRHKRREFLLFSIVPTSSTAKPAISIPSTCFATQSSVYLPTTSNPRTSTSERGRRRCKWCVETFICLASAPAAQVYDRSETLQL